MPIPGSPAIRGWGFPFVVTDHRMSVFVKVSVPKSNRSVESILPVEDAREPIALDTRRRRIGIGYSVPMSPPPITGVSACLPDRARLRRLPMALRCPVAL